MTSNKSYTKTSLEGFRDYIVKQSKSNLTRKGKNVSKSLYNSISGNVKVSANSIELDFQMEEHGLYIDQGVKGKTSSAKAPNSPFKFGTGTGKKGGLTKGIENWVKRRRFQFKDRQTGKFMSYEQTARLITRSVYNKGIAPTEFFTKPFEAGFKRLPEFIIEAYGLDVESTLKYVIDKQNGKQT